MLETTGEKVRKMYECGVLLKGLSDQRLEGAQEKLRQYGGLNSSIFSTPLRQDEQMGVSICYSRIRIV